MKIDFGEVVTPSDSELLSLFPHTQKQRLISFVKGTVSHQPLKVGVVFSGGQASGGHNVIAGLFDTLKKMHPESTLIGFLGGPSGITDNHTKEIDSAIVAPYRGQGGFDLIGSGRTKIETPEQFSSSLKTVQEHGLDGLVIIGGDDSNTNAAFLAEYFAANGCKIRVVGVPKTIDGDLKNDYIETSFGFDTATKTYAHSIGSVARDALSAGKYYFFIKLMGRSASHIALRCAELTHPNLTLISEEVEEKNLSFQDVVKEICQLIEKRAAVGKHHGVILIPEGLIEFLNLEGVEGSRDPHGNLEVSKIETERLLLEAVKKQCTVPFKGQPLFFGYEGRCCQPSSFDARYCTLLGETAARLIDQGANGYVATVRNLEQLGGCPILAMMTFESRNGHKKAVIAKALVDIKGEEFTTFAGQRDQWILDDDYCYPIPIQQ